MSAVFCVAWICACDKPLGDELGEINTAPEMNVPLISREVFFAQPTIEAPLLSPDGNWISAAMPLNGVMNYFVFPADNPGARRPVTTYPVRDVDPTTGGDSATYFWSGDSRYLIFSRDRNGDEAHHVMRVDVVTGEIKDLTPIDDGKVTLFAKSNRRPNELLIGLDDRQPGKFDLYRLDIETGERILLEQNDRFIGYIADNDLEPRVAVAIEAMEGAPAMVRYYRNKGEDWRMGNS